MANADEARRRKGRRPAQRTAAASGAKPTAAPWSGAQLTTSCRPSDKYQELAEGETYDKELTIGFVFKEGATGDMNARSTRMMHHHVAKGDTGPSYGKRKRWVPCASLAVPASFTYTSVAAVGAWPKGP